MTRQRVGIDAVPSEALDSHMIDKSKIVANVNAVRSRCPRSRQADGSHRSEGPGVGAILRTSESDRIPAERTQSGKRGDDAQSIHRAIARDSRNFYRRPYLLREALDTTRF